MRTIKFNYLFQNGDTGLIHSKTWTLEEIERGAVQIHLNQLKSHYIVARREFVGILNNEWKDFYEGDIIRDTRDDSIGNDVIEWDGYRFIMKNYDDNDDVFHCPEYYEVIGNIYENPDLMKR